MSTFNKWWVRGVLKRNEGNPPLGLFCSKDIVFILFCIYEEFWSQDKPVYDFVNTGIRIMQFWFHEVYILVPLVQVVPTSFEKYNSWSVKDYGTPCSFSKEQNRFRPKEFFSRLFPHLISISISDGSFYHLFIIIRFEKIRDSPALVVWTLRYECNGHWLFGKISITQKVMQLERKGWVLPNYRENEQNHVRPLFWKVRPVSLFKKAVSQFKTCFGDRLCSNFEAERTKSKLVMKLKTISHFNKSGLSFQKAVSHLKKTVSIFRQAVSNFKFQNDRQSKFSNFFARNFYHGFNDQ